MRRAFAVWAILAGQCPLLTAGTVAAALPLEYTAPAGCPDRAAFLREVNARLPRSAGKATAVRVVIEAVSGEFFARLEVIDPGGAIAEREINGLFCQQVSSAMALVVALVLTELGQQEQSLPAPRPEGEKSAPSVFSGQPALATPPQPAANTPAERPAIEWFPGSDTKRGVAPSGRAIPLEIGLLATASGGIAPVPAWGGWFYVEVGDFARPAARLNLGARTTVAVERHPGTASFDWFGGRLDGCWPLLVYAGKAGVAGCASFEAAALRGQGDRIDNPHSTVDPWLALGLFARPGWRAGAFVVQAEVGPTFPLIRRTFVFGSETAPEAKIYEQPAVAVHFGVGAGVRL